MSREQVLRTLEQHRLIAILRGDFKGQELEIVNALIQGGVKVLEISTASPEYMQVIRRVVDEFGTKITVGAGTVLTLEHLAAIADAGASFVVSPDSNPNIIAGTRERQLASFPGAYTPTEILRALEYGADAVKLFPAACLGPEYVQALRAPLSNIQLIPTGGVHIGNVSDYLKAGAWAVAVGSELVRSNEADLKEWTAIRLRAEQLVALTEGRCA